VGEAQHQWAQESRVGADEGRARRQQRDREVDQGELRLVTATGTAAAAAAVVGVAAVASGAGEEAGYDAEEARAVHRRAQPVQDLPTEQPTQPAKVCSKKVQRQNGP